MKNWLPLVLELRREAAALDHEIRDDAMEVQSVVITTLCQVDEACHRQWRLVGEKIDLDRALGCLEQGDERACCCHG